MSKAKAMKKVNEEDRGVYLVVDDGSEEFEMTLVFSTILAEVNHAHLAILYMMEDTGFTHWGGIASKMESEARKNAEQRLWDAANKAHSINGIFPALFLEEGNVKDVIPQIMQNNPEIKRLMLGGSTKSATPGPLVAYFCGKGFSRLTAPITVIPDNIDMDQLTSLI